VAQTIDDLFDTAEEKHVVSASRIGETETEEEVEA
jgi:hypothetical protein